MRKTQDPIMWVRVDEFLSTNYYREEAKPSIERKPAPALSRQGQHDVLKAMGTFYCSKYGVSLPSTCVGKQGRSIRNYEREYTKIYISNNNNYNDNVDDDSAGLKKKLCAAQKRAKIYDGSRGAVRNTFTSYNINEYRGAKDNENRNQVYMEEVSFF